TLAPPRPTRITTTAPPSPTGVRARYSYEGCYSDDSLLDLELANIPVIDPSHATQESCEHHCSSSGYVYFALEFGFLCRCGNELPDPAREAEAEMCDQV
ncbi:unnamed protein product, partial [Laminaria digitata]